MTIDFYENLGKRVRELRIKNGLTQEQVAEALDVTPGYISNVENNRSAMTLRILIYYAELTNISLDRLIGDLEPSYYPTALNHDLSLQIEKLSDIQKQKLIETIKLWID